MPSPTSSPPKNPVMRMLRHVQSLRALGDGVVERLRQLVFDRRIAVAEFSSSCVGHVTVLPVAWCLGVPMRQA
jgi:hypothetical protein